MSIIVSTKHLTKSFQGKEVVSDVSMNIFQGEIYGFLGPNGSGKTTVMKMLLNLVKPTSGDIEIFGEPLTYSSIEYLKRVGSIIEFPVFYDKLTALENLELHCAYMGFYNKKALKETLELVHLTNVDQKSVRDFSLGMKQRLGIARAMITRPELLILDEPINGLDPSGMKDMRSIFSMLSKEYGMTLLISSHLLGEVEVIADTIGIIKSGRLIREISMDTMRGQGTDYVELKTPDYQKAAFILESKLQLRNFKVMDNAIIRIYDTGIAQSDISKTLILNDINIESINKRTASLEEYFLTQIEGVENVV
ncbi:ATP-binding cassette domain-containing protein [Paenibacillus crassostreae]|uniref:Bacitracin ABC transporter ATP-binding protein n=1 Tax=Paenibacillus crassostreae TaxID=1763538 RepID=A0A167GLP5_9BACL|nr:ATP-binding cassette domain-containing protein [Paenibacillus crassostreae]AOZ92231.1 bacitracin ABC transporter ATP-binding protein [Paenibacillus crassostreae]OAB77694.1 bacitracin ABC transporter ATP-binding protein [Paenibacillus crassostreae]